MPLFATNKPSRFYGAWQRSFFVTLFFITLASFLFWLDTFRGYEAEIRVLIIGKSPSTSTDQVVENFAELTSNLSFYERVLENNDLIDDAFEGQTKDRRKVLWNKAVVVKQSEKSGVLIILARQNTSEQSKRLAEETVQTLFSLAPFYYNIKTDVDLRVIDGVIVKPAFFHPVQYVLASIGSALGVTVIFFWLLSITPFFFREREVEKKSRASVIPSSHTDEKAHQEFALGSAVPYIDPQKFVPARPATLTFESSHEEQQILQEILAPVAERETQVEGPVWNERMLPGMDVESLPFEFEETFPENKGEESVKEAAPGVESLTKEIPRGEPTVEEYKRRLNELLAGGK